MSLNDPILAASKQIVDASKNSPPLRRGSSGPGVAILQASLVDLGYRMPTSTRNAGKPDGIYGKETKGVVAEFQERNGLNPDGSAGRNTIRTIDQRLTSMSRKPKTAPIPKAPSKKPAEYKIGHQDPQVPMDPKRPHGNSEKTVRGYLIWRALWTHTSMRGGSIGVAFGLDAAKSMRHYLGNTGRPFKVRFRALVAENHGVLQRYKNEINLARQFVEQLPLGNHNITSVAPTTLHATQTKNWALTVGGLNAWGKGKAIVKEDNSGRHYELYFEYKFKDRYNFDSEKGFTVIEDLPVSAKNIGLPLTDGGVRIVGDELEVRDTLLKRLHEEGYAKDFVTHGSFIKHASWRHGRPLPADFYNPRV